MGVFAAAETTRRQKETRRGGPFAGHPGELFFTPPANLFTKELRDDESGSLRREASK